MNNQFVYNDFWAVRLEAIQAVSYEVHTNKDCSISPRVVLTVLGANTPTYLYCGTEAEAQDAWEKIFRVMLLGNKSLRFVPNGDGWKASDI